MSWSGSETSMLRLLRPPLHDRRGSPSWPPAATTASSAEPSIRLRRANVLAVGGTTLQVGSSGNYQGETAWVGTSGGFSTIETEPSYQFSVQSSGCRSTPDVAFDGDPNTGVEVYSMDPYSGQGSWLTVAGTSLGAPAWAATIAIVDQGRALNNRGPRLRPDADRPLQPSYVRLPRVGGGYNQQTGLGTPNGGSLINDLVAYDPSTGRALHPSQRHPPPRHRSPLGRSSLCRSTRHPVSTTPVSHDAGRQPPRQHPHRSAARRPLFNRASPRPPPRLPSEPRKPRKRSP